jgi:hypothetical protein
LKGGRNAAPFVILRFCGLRNLCLCPMVAGYRFCGAHDIALQRIRICRTNNQKAGDYTTAKMS